MDSQPIRQVAYKVWVSDLVNNEYKQEKGEWEPNYVLVHDKKVSRVNIIANVITNYKNEQGDYVSITMDDGSASIQVKAWKEDVSLIEGLEVGTTVLIIGRIREYNNEKYLTPEIVRKLDKPEWLIYRKKEITKEYGDLIKKTEQTKKENGINIVTEEEVVDSPSREGNRQKILNIIENLSSEEGADKLEIIKEAQLDEQTADGIIQSLLMEGEIFEIKPGKIKILG